MKTRTLGTMWLSASVRFLAWTLILGGMWFATINHAHATGFWYWTTNVNGTSCGPATDQLSNVGCAIAIEQSAQGLGSNYVLASCNGSTSSGGTMYYHDSNDTNPSSCVSNGWTQLNARYCYGTDQPLPPSFATCGPPGPTCTAGSAMPDTPWYGTNPIGTYVCYGGCQVSVGVSNGASQFRNKGTYGGLMTGAACTSADTAATPSSTPVACTTGKCPGTVNGVEVCVPCTASSGATASSTYTPPAGSTAGSVDAPANGSTVVSVETTKTANPDGTVTTNTVTRTTSYDPTTGAGTTTTQTASRVSSPIAADNPIKSFCTENPTASICQTKTFGGACGGSFSCGGDAIECAIAQDQHIRNCTLFDTATTLSDLGNSAAAGTDSGVTDNPAKESNRETTDVSGAISQSTWLSGSCPAPVSTTIAGRSFTLSFTSLCSVLGIIGALGVAVTMVIAGVMLSGAIRS